MTRDPGDNWIDNELRNVAVPAELPAKLQAIALLDDAELDRALCDVPVPAGLMARLHSIGTFSDADLDDELRDIAPPRHLIERLRRVPAAVRHKATRVQTIQRLAMAACLLLAIGIGYLAAIAPWSGNRSSDNRTDSLVSTKDQGTTSGRAVDSVASQPGAHRSNTINDSLDDPKLAQLPPWKNFEGKQPDDPGSIAGSEIPNLARGNSPESKRDGRNNTPSDDGALASPGSGIENLPPLRSLAEPTWRGVTPPRERGYDFSFQLKHGVHPFVSPSVNPALATAQVPLVTSTASFDGAWQSVQDGKLPSAFTVRPEEFLAAMDYAFARPEGRPVAIRTAAGASPWNGSGVNLLQVAAQAGDLPRDGEPAHTILVLDASPSMQWESRWANALRGIAEFARRLGPNDRLSLIVAADKPEIGFEGETAEAAGHALQPLFGRGAARTSNVAGAIQKGVELGRTAKVSAAHTQLVLLTDGIAAPDDAASQSLQRDLQDAAGRGQFLHVIDVRQEETIDQELNRLAATAADTVASKYAGTVRHADAPSAIRWLLVEIVAGKPQVVVAQAAMKVTFKPDAVAMYRLIGHEATSVVGLMSTTIETDLRTQEAATGLFEVVLKPGGGETVATVELTWRDVAGGQQQAIRQTISRFQFAPSFHESPLSLQLAALAGETAEILRDSYFAPPNSHSLDEVARLARELNPRLQKRESFVRLLQLVERAQRTQASGR